MFPSCLIAGSSEIIILNKTFPAEFEVQSNSDPKASTKRCNHGCLLTQWLVDSRCDILGRRFLMTITKNLTYLIDEVNLDRLYPLLIAEGIIGSEDVSRIQREFATLSRQACDFFMWYQTRGPTAFSTLIQSLKQSGHESAADILLSQENPGGGLLDPRESNISNGYANGERSEDEFHRIEHSPEISDLTEVVAAPLEIVVQPAVLYNNGNFDSETTYEMMLKPRGFALIINNIKFASEDIGKFRSGAEYDTIHLKKLFEAFDFEVTFRHNITRDDLDNVFDEFIRKFELTSVNACFVAVMSHGHEDCLLMRDGSYALIWTDIVSRLNNRNCPTLMRIPKIFLINACRGDQRDHGVSVQETYASVSTSRLSTTHTDQCDDEIHPPIEFKKDPQVRDIIVCYSSVPGFVANRAIDLGTWYVYTFCEVFMKNAHNTELKKMLDMVGREMELKCIANQEHQVPSYAVYGFNYDFYFNPGLEAQTSEEEDSVTNVV
ncbi:unnamed protein product [Allacma fusca]|uniref:Caspase-8 n=1 Tax=Allacma fusca TaxID=39272 RepID=A0A8J2K0B8_9HEXA|nr:unnamed protein product [Allacma fusca]